MVFIPILAVLFFTSPAMAQDVDGPVRATVVRVIDGDTVEIDAHVWPGHTVRVSVRLRGIDAPELRARCEAERVLAEEARAYLAELVGSGLVHIRNVRRDKFYGRVIADLETDAGEDIAHHLLQAQFARPYDGKARASWCAGPD